MNWMEQVGKWLAKDAFAAQEQERERLCSQFERERAELTGQIKRLANEIAFHVASVEMSAAKLAALQTASAAQEAELRQRLRYFGPCTIPPQSVVDLARVLVQQWAKAEATGEFKRHRVYGALQHEFPNVPKSQLALAIELVKNGG